MTERDLIVKYLRGLAEKCRDGGRTALGRQLANMQSKTLYDVANEIKQGAHMPKDEP